MLDALEPVARAVDIDLDAFAPRTIAIVGAGAIVDLAHLPAYHSAGFSVRGITDVQPDRARDVATRHGIDVVYPDLDALLADDAVEIVDVAVPAAAQPEIARRVLSSGRHMLAQKPFALSSAVAAELVALAAEHGVVLAVNQQLRYDEGIAAAHAMLSLGFIGEPLFFEIDVNIDTDWSAWPWMLDAAELEVWNHSIHYHDVVRHFLGEPTTVHALGTRVPGQRARAETRTLATYTFASGACARVQASHVNTFGDPYARFRLEGTAGAIRGTLGLLYDYPSGRPDTLEVTSSVVPTDGWLAYPVTRRWIPDAFVAPMASVIRAAGGGPEPITSGRDNVSTLLVVEAIYRSIHTGEAQFLQAPSTT